MQFFFLVLINIFIGAVLYLVISLKLERSAQEFRSRRLRKEMDDIIKEFNATAERNITLLENRITVLQRLLERSGGIKSLDISIDDGPAEPAAGQVQEPPRAREAVNVSAPREARETGSDFSGAIVRRMRDGVASLLDALDRRMHKNTGSENPAEVPERREAPAAEDRVETVYLDDAEIRDMIMSAENRYEAITMLHGSGYSLEDISRCSGIPAGEIALVLNLKHDRTS